MTLGSTALRIATLMFLFIARIRFPASYSYTLEKSGFKHKKAILDLDFLYLVKK